MKKVIRSIRRSQTVTPFGVGAIYDLGDESFVAQDISQWKGGEWIYLKRLENALGVDHFRMAPVSVNGFKRPKYRVPYMRFPRWHFCARCRRMTFWLDSHEKRETIPSCQYCDSDAALVPMRFVAVCAEGHMDDVPWGRWAHLNAREPKQKQCRVHNLEYRSRGGSGAGLESLLIHCRTCKVERSLQGLSQKDSLQRVGKGCSGKQPWQPKTAETDCRETPQVLQRGASNVYYSRVISALDIREESAATGEERYRIEIEASVLYKALKTLIETQDEMADDNVINSLAQSIADEVGCAVDTVIETVKGFHSKEPPTERDPQAIDNLLREEWHAFLNPPTEVDMSSPFVAKKADVESHVEGLSEHEQEMLSPLLGLVGKVVLAHRLREVRVLEGFERYKPGTLVRSDLGRMMNWLPAIEVFGEGIFFSLDEQALRRWESGLAYEMTRRVATIAENLESSHLDFLPDPTPRFILLHTVAHLLIRQLSFECGYSASSLRERIYSSDSREDKGNMAGILVYTADSDSEGSLGGLVRQGQPDRFFTTLLAALSRATWCSSDPICSELPSQGFDGLNKAACHACILVSETSCASMNVLLDRVLLVGTYGGQEGYFSKALMKWEVFHANAEL